MSEAVGAATLELLTWISSRPRTYPEAMEAWRSHCPRLAIWEDALIAGLVQVVRGSGETRQGQVMLTAQGRAALDEAAAA